MNGFELISASAAFSALAHGMQRRKELNEIYVLHTLRVAAAAARLGCNAEFIAACNLHDVLEDTHTTHETLRTHFPQNTVDLVVAVSKWWPDGLQAEVVKAHKKTYYSNICKQPGAPLLKVLDRTDNLQDFARIARISANTHRKAKAYVEKSKEEFVEILKLVVDSRPIDEYYSALQALEKVVGDGV